METDRSTAQEVEELSRTLERLRSDYATLEAEHATKNATMVEQHHQSTADALWRAEIEHTAAVQKLTEAAEAADEISVVERAALEREQKAHLMTKQVRQDVLDHAEREHQTALDTQKAQLEAAHAAAVEEHAASLAASKTALHHHHREKEQALGEVETAKAAHAALAEEKQSFDSAYEILSEQ